MDSSAQTGTAGFLPREGFQSLLELLEADGYRCIGPQVRDGAVVYDTLDDVRQLPAGLRVHQEPGSYAIDNDGSHRWFAWSNGPQALKPLLFAPSVPLWSASRDAGGGLEFTRVVTAAAKRAVIGVRPCDLAGLQLQDEHFREGYFPDPDYVARRNALFLVAVNCTQPSATCFCASTGDGPAATAGFDLMLDELEDGFIVHAGSDAGRRIVAGLELSPVAPQQLAAADEATAGAAAMQHRSLPSRNLHNVLLANLDHPRWHDVAERCLACGNCTLVCPTCFCYRESDHLTVDGNTNTRNREWDSCFSQGHSYIHGKVIRDTTRLRYRQWLTHKLGTWHEQYGRSGCVGCGRCIAWCPVGIDITEEAGAIYGDGNDA